MNTARLREKVEKSGLTVEELAASVGINPSTYYRKMNTNGENFTVAQAKKMAAILGLTNEEASEIFLA